MQSAHAADRGHEHSNGASEVCFYMEVDLYDDVSLIALETQLFQAPGARQGARRVSCMFQACFRPPLLHPVWKQEQPRRFVPRLLAFL
jgi:hypothetical protein